MRSWISNRTDLHPLPLDKLLHTHVLFVASLTSDCITQSDTDQHQSRFTLRKTVHPQARRQISQFDRSMTLWILIRVQCSLEKTIENGLIDAVLHPLGSFFQFHGVQFLPYSFGFFSDCNHHVLIGIDSIWSKARWTGICSMSCYQRAAESARCPETNSN